MTCLLIVLVGLCAVGVCCLMLLVVCRGDDKGYGCLFYSSLLVALIFIVRALIKP